MREVDEPSTMREAQVGDHATEWKAAADSEYSLLVENETWGLVELLPNRNAFGCIWCIFNVKHRVDGTVQRFKARFGAPKNMRLTLTLLAVVGLCCSEWHASSPDGCSYSLF